MTSKLRIALVVALGLAVAACSGSSSDTSSSTGGSGSTSSGGSTAGGTTSGGSTGGGVQALLGNWQVSGNGSVTFDNDGGSGASSSTTPIATYQVSFARGTTSDLVSLDSAGCQLLWTVSGNTATLNVPQSCSTTGQGVPGITWTANSGSLTLTVTDANHLSGSGDIVGIINDTSRGQSNGAHGQAVGTLTRVGS